MADLRICARLPATPSSTPARPLPPARAEAVRAAQRAFFETALAGEAQQTTRAAAPVAAAAPAAAPTPAPPVPPTRAFDPDAPAPTRLLRPGSLLDIKV